MHIRATAASKGAQVTVLRQGYLLKKNSGGLRREWKRRFFVLDSSGMLYYYSAKVLAHSTPRARCITSPPRCLNIRNPLACCATAPPKPFHDSLVSGCPLSTTPL